jgi:hypothetical protein
MHNAGVSIFRDEKPDVFYLDNYAAPSELTVTAPAFYTSREMKEVGLEFIKIHRARAVGILLTETTIFIVYNTGGSLMKWEKKAELTTKTAIINILCNKRLQQQYDWENIRAMMFGSSIEQMYQLLTSNGGVKKNLFALDNTYDYFPYFTTDRAGDIGLSLLCDEVKSTELNDILSQDLYERNPGYVVINDAMTENGEPVLFAYDCDMRRIKKFSDARKHHSIKGIIICFDYQEEILRQFDNDNLLIETIDLKKLERRFF